MKAILLNKSMDYVVHNPIGVEVPPPLYLRIAVQPQGATLVQPRDAIPTADVILTDEYRMVAVGQGVAFYVWDRRL